MLGDLMSGARVAAAYCDCECPANGPFKNGAMFEMSTIHGFETRRETSNARKRQINIGLVPREERAKHNGPCADILYPLPLFLSYPSRDPYIQVVILVSPVHRNDPVNPKVHPRYTHACSRMN